MRSVTAWGRLESIPRASGPDQGLEARLHDPLWLLARQWQFGEFLAIDGGSPITVRARLTACRLTRFKAPAAAEPEPYQPGEPLEARVEREPPAGPVGLRAAARGGLRLLADLRTAGLDRYASSVRNAFGFPPDTATGAVGASLAQRMLSVLRGRAPDGRVVAAAIRAATPAPPAELHPDTADVGQLMSVLSSWLAWWDAEIEPPAPASCWIPERFEHQFQVAAPAPGGAATQLQANRYEGGELDWHDFDLATGAATLGAETDATADTLTASVRTVVPTRVSFSAMPADRWWQFEDAIVDLGRLDTSPTDLPHLLLSEFALSFGNDWLVVPVDLAYGTVCAVESVVVTDTFGLRTLIQPTAVASPGGWRMFTLTGAPPDASLLFVPPVLAAPLTGRPLEEIALARDEMANMAWGVERTVQGTTGDPIDRADELAGAPAEAPPSLPVDSEALAYRLATAVPEYWLPLIPVKGPDGDGDVRLQLGAMLRFTPGPNGQPLPTPIPPAGRVLDDYRTPLLHDAEVPREGVRVRRVPVLARWTDGTTWMWIARRAQIGRGEASSGLQFDVVSSP
jgi:hypothetical protein